MIHALAGVGMIYPTRTMSWGCGGRESMGRLSLMFTSVWVLFFPCMSF